MNAPTIQHKALKKSQARLVELERELSAEQRAVDVAAANLQAVKRADAQARQDARAQGKDKPEPKAEAEAKRLEIAKEEVADTAGAIEKVQADLDRAIKAHRPEIEQQIKTALAKVRAEYSSALEELAARHRQMAAHEAELAWLREGKWTPDAEHTVPLNTKGGSDIPRDMPTKLSIDMVLDGLRARAQTPRPKIVEAPAPPLGRSLIGHGVNTGSPLLEKIL